MIKNIFLGVNIDHVATLRQARGTLYPSPLEAAFAAINGGADNITLHLREDRRHIQDKDVLLLKEILTIPMNFEMALTPEMLDFAEKIKPQQACFVPEKREELTTEGGLDVVKNFSDIQAGVSRLQQHDIRVSLFIDPDLEQIDAAVASGASEIEIHTGHYAELVDEHEQQEALRRIKAAALYADEKGLVVHAGHGLHVKNVSAIANIDVFHTLNIGHALVARALFCGLESAVKEIKHIMLTARQNTHA